MWKYFIVHSLCKYFIVHCKLVEWFGWGNIHNKIVWDWPCPSYGDLCSNHFRMWYLQKSSVFKKEILPKPFPYWTKNKPIFLPASALCCFRITFSWCVPFVKKLFYMFCTFLLEDLILLSDIPCLRSWVTIRVLTGKKTYLCSVVYHNN